MGSKNTKHCTNSCLTLHQPWASLLVHGIKRVEGRSWPAPIRGRLWIHAAGKVPDPTTIKAMEDFYREIYAVDGIVDLKFPEYYPVSRLVGCVEVVGCIKRRAAPVLHNLDPLLQVKLEGKTDFCWLCEEPNKLIVPLEMRGHQRIFNLDNQLYEAAVRGLCPVDASLPIKFPLPDPQDLFSLKPGSLGSNCETYKVSELDEPRSVSAAIAGGQAAAAQFSKKRNCEYSAIQGEAVPVSARTRKKLEESWIYC